MKLTVMIQRRWWSDVTKCPRSGRKTNAPGWREFTSLPRWKNVKMRKWRCPGVWILCGLPGRTQEMQRNVEEVCCTNCSFTHFDRVKNTFQLKTKQNQNQKTTKTKSKWKAKTKTKTKTTTKHKLSTSKTSWSQPTHPVHNQDALTTSKQSCSQVSCDTGLN